MAVTADGEFGAVEIDGVTNAIDTDVQCYQMGAGVIGIGELTVVNRNTTSVQVRVGVVPNGASVFQDARYLEYDTEVLPSAPLKVTNVVIGNQGQLYVRSDTVDVNFMVYGITKSE